MSFEHIRSTTFEMDVTVTEGTGEDKVPVDLTGWTLTSQIQLGGANDRQDLFVEAVDLSEGQIRLRASAEQTADWTVTESNRRSFLDVRAVQGEEERLTRRIEIVVLDFVTRRAAA